MKSGRYNAGVGLLVMAGYMFYGFVLIYLRDFAPDKEAWIAGYSVGKHFEARLAHVHGNLFSVLNIALAFVLARLTTASDRGRSAVAVLALAGLLMPAGILAEIYLGFSPIFVLIGAAAMTASVILAGLLALRHWAEAR
jgi:poly(3-hydroxybutyrate) depolymerase